MPGIVQLPAPTARPLLPRRRLLRAAFWTGAGLTVLAAALALDRFLQAGGPDAPGVVRVPADAVPPPGSAPLYLPGARGYRVNLHPGEGGYGTHPGSSHGGLVALAERCTHLGQCRLPWRSEFEFEGERGWFRCPCHGSTYTKAGIRVFGPAPRDMDTLDLSKEDNGDVLVHIAPIHRGAADS